MKVRRRRFAGVSTMLAAKARPIAGRCNYPTEGGRKFCRLSAGKATTHPGSGYCKKHDTHGYDPIHRYRNIKQKSIRQGLRDLVSRERNVFDLIPEILILRAMLIDFIERHFEFKEALIAWFKDGKMKPKGPLDITDASHLVEAISRLIERHHRIEREGSISMETFNIAMEKVGIVVAHHVRDGKILNAIEADWEEISLDSKSLPAAVPTVTHKVTSESSDAK